jgi:hypothetical protein
MAHSKQPILMFCVSWFTSNCIIKRPDFPQKKPENLLHRKISEQELGESEFSATNPTNNTLGDTRKTIRSNRPTNEKYGVVTNGQQEICDTLQEMHERMTKIYDLLSKQEKWENSWLEQEQLAISKSIKESIRFPSVGC